MSYLLPVAAGRPSRRRATKSRGLGVLPYAKGDAYNFGPPTMIRQILHWPQPRCVPGDMKPEGAAVWDPVACRWVGGGIFPPSPPAPPPSAGTPVPAGFPTNQFFVAPDGSVWEYSVSANQWINTGTPYNVNPPPSAPTAAPSGSGDASAPAAPVNITVAPTPATSSGYQAILDWLTQQTLVTGIPNWLVGSGVALLAYKAMGSGGKR